MRSIARNLVRTRVPSSALRPVVNNAKYPLFNTMQQRGYYTVQNLNREQVAEMLNQHHDELLGCNWGDYLELVQNVPFFEAHMEKLQKHCEPYLNDPEIGPKMDYVLMATDAMYACEDVRDHCNEILELMTRKTGILGMGINAGEAVENLDEQSEMLSKRYEELMTEFPEMKPKIEQSVGHGLAILRMKHKFRHPSGYRFFY